MAHRLTLSPTLSLPLDAVTETTAILGIRGSGKTTTATVFAEELLRASQQVVIIDPVDVWWGLKSSADGKAPGFPVVILGGKHGDLPLQATDGATVADFIVDEGASVILAVRHFESRADMRRFVADLCNRLYFRKGETGRESPLHVFIDEASLFVPQRVMAEEAKCVASIQRLVRQGRASGFGVTLIDQRPATVNKDVLTQLELLVCHRVSSPQDRKALDAWIEQHDAHGRAKDFLTSLAALPQGTAWFWSPGWLDVFAKVAVRARSTFDSSRTPKAGERVVAPREVAPIDMAALKGKLAASIERARQDDPKVLHARIRELEQAAKHQAPATAAADSARLRELIETLNVFAKTGAFGIIRAQCERLVGHVEGEMQDIINGLFEISETLKKAAGASAPTVSTYRASETGASAVALTVRPARREPARLDLAAIGKTPLKMVNALMQLRLLGVDPCEREVIAGWCGISANTGSFRTYLSELRVKGYIADAAGGRVQLTDAGEAIAEATEIPSLASLHDLWRSKLGGTPARMLTELIRQRQRPVSREALGQLIGISHETGSFRTYLSELRRPGLIVDVDRAHVAASTLLFPPGLS